MFEGTLSIAYVTNRLISVLDFGFKWTATVICGWLSV